MRFCWHKWSNWRDDAKSERQRQEAHAMFVYTFIPGQHRRCAKCNRVERRST